MVKVMTAFAKKFEVDIKGWENASKAKIKFLGHDIKQDPADFSIEVDQSHYIKENVKEIEIAPHRQGNLMPLRVRKKKSNNSRPETELEYGL